MSKPPGLGRTDAVPELADLPGASAPRRAGRLEGEAYFRSAAARDLYFEQGSPEGIGGMPNRSPSGVVAYGDDIGIGETDAAGLGRHRGRKARSSASWRVHQIFKIGNVMQTTFMVRASATRPDRGASWAQGARSSARARAVARQCRDAVGGCWTRRAVGSPLLPCASARIARDRKKGPQSAHDSKRGRQSAR